ncbi:MAG: helix-turn-helix transcriptional regulator [Candidatus Hydrogenedentes bacterium]|nr:helix-turn-helix transcriptional regulator [Candidatus Hydrogenedentota bacterium]
MKKQSSTAEGRTELNRYLDQLSPMDPASRNLDDIAALERDPAFVADCLKGQLVEHILQAMEAQHLSKSDLAKRLHTSRQYVTRVLNEKANFTVDSIAEIACALGMGVRLELRPPATAKPGTKAYGKQGRKSMAKAGTDRAAEYPYVAEDGDE